MVILFSRTGQLANRLWQAAYLISNAIENNYKFLHLGFAEYNKYFDENILREFKKQHIKCKIIDFKKTSIQDRLIIKYANYSRKFELKYKFSLPFIKSINIWETYDISTISFKELANSRIVLTDGWIYKDINSLKKYSDFIRQIFTPNNAIIDNIKKIRNEYFLKYDKVVGIHLRRNDYSIFKDGKWFYSNQDYIMIMKKILTAFGFEKKNIGFFLCSDEKIIFKDFYEFNIIISTNHFVEDLYALAMCDYISGPPSTYSSWASFYGEVPLLHVYDKTKEIFSNDFKIMNEKFNFCF